MNLSEKPRIELATARTCIELMRNAKSLDEFEKNWQSFLHCLERLWYKTNYYYGKSLSWNGWKGKYQKMRADDPLLVYLINARGADEHTVNPILARVPGGIGIKGAKGKDLYIKKMIIRKGNIFIDSPQKIQVDFLPARTTLLPAINRGQTYAVPTTHLGKPINPENVAEVAKTGADFYETFLNDVETRFSK